MHTHRFCATLDHFGYLFDLLPLPTAHDHTGLHDPIRWAMPTARQFAYLLFFFLILRCSRFHILGHPSSLLSLSAFPPYFTTF
jgi:hypothetical protein